MPLREPPPWVRRGAAALRGAPAHLLVAAGCGVSAIIAIVLSLVTDQTPHRIWGLIAAAGYAAAGAAALTTRRPLTGLRVAALGTVLVPMVVLVVSRLAQPEVGVVERSARLLVTTGSPYDPHPIGVYEVNPYLPVMSFFGLPRLMFPDNGAGDARWWFLLVFVVTFVAADRLARRGRGTEAALWAVLASPVVALPAAVGGHDLPVVGLLCLSIALAGRGSVPQAGLVLGVACALKASAWPALAVVGALVVVRYGWRHAGRFVANALAVLAGTVIPVLVSPTARAALAQVAGFPMGTGTIASPASAPTPGVLLAHGGAVARFAGYLLLGVVAAALVAWLVLRPPHTLASAGAFLAVALTAAALVLPTSRGGYLLYPAVLGTLALRGRRRHPAPVGLPRWGGGLVPALPAGPDDERVRWDVNPRKGPVRQQSRPPLRPATTADDRPAATGPVTAGAAPRPPRTRAAERRPAREARRTAGGTRG